MVEGMFRKDGYDYNITAFDTRAEAQEAVDIAFSEEGEDCFNAWVEDAPAPALGKFMVACRKAPNYDLYYL